MDCSTSGFPVLHYLPEFAQAHVPCVGDAIQPFHPLWSPSPWPSIFPSIRVFSNESALCIRWPKLRSFSFSISPSNEYSGFISFRIDWFDLLAVQRTFKSLLQHHNSKASILWHSAFFITSIFFKISLFILIGGFHTSIFYDSCIGRPVLYHTTWEAPLIFIFT